MILRLAVIFILNAGICLISIQVGANTGPLDRALSAEDLYVHLDQNYNVIRRVQVEPNTAVLSEDVKRAREVLLFELPPAAKEYRSEFAAVDDLKRVTGPAGGRLVPVFADSAEAAKFAGPVVAKLKAYKLMGKSSYYLSESAEGYGGLFFAVHPKDFEDVATRAIETTDYLKAASQGLHSKYRDSIIPQFLAVRMNGSGTDQGTVVYRSAEILHHSPNGGTVVPMHGFLGCATCVEEVARVAGMSVHDWKTKKLLPELAEFTAMSHLDLGASFEAHTQNLLMEIDRKSGKFTLYVRDFSDVLLHPLLRLANKHTHLGIDWSRARYRNIAFASWVEDDKPQFADFGLNVAAYTTQAVDSHIENQQERYRMNAQFTRLYLAAMEKRLGRSLELSVESAAILHSLETATRDSQILTGTGPKGKTTRRNAVGAIITDIYEKAFAVLAQEKLLPRFRREPHLTEDFRNALLKNEVSFSSKIGRSRIEEKPSGFLSLFKRSTAFSPSIQLGKIDNQIVAIDAQTNEVLGSTFTRSEPRSAPACPLAFGTK